MNQLADDLRAARALIQTKEEWQRLGGWNALLETVGEGRAYPAYELLEQTTPTINKHFRYYENDPRTTHPDVLALFDRAIASAESQS